MSISSRPFADRSSWVYKQVAEEAKSAFDDPSKAGSFTTPLTNLYRLLERLKHDAFVLSYPPGVLKGSSESQGDLDRPRYLKLTEVEQALKESVRTVYKNQNIAEVVPALQSVISDLVSNRPLPPNDERLRQGSKFLKRFSSQLHP